MITYIKFEGDKMGQKIDVCKCVIDDLNKKYFEIPEYQRPYVWTKDNVETLLEDIDLNKNEKEYFLGTIVLKKKEKKMNLKF